MTTEEIVQQLVKYINAGQNVQAEEELYADNVLSVEQNGYSVQGKEAVIAKTKGAFESFEAFHGGGVTTAFVGKDNFILEFKLDVTPKGGERMMMHEFGFYKLQDGKVVEEYFYAEPTNF